MSKTPMMEAPLTLDLNLVPPQVLSRLMAELEQNREFDMGGYSVPTDTVFAQFQEPAEAITR